MKENDKEGGLDGDMGRRMGQRKMGEKRTNINTIWKSHTETYCFVR